MKYTGISIGPVIRTLSMARKPRELWAASYMLSYLMKCIYSQIPQQMRIVSPIVSENEIPNNVGIYPDRLYVEGELDAKSVFEKSKEEFLKGVGLTCDSFDNYFNLMSAVCDANTDSVAIDDLSQKLDVMELCNFAADIDSTGAIYNVISPFKKKESLLYKLATGEEFSMETLAEIATVQLMDIDPKKWKDARSDAKVEEKVIERLKKDLARIGREIPYDLLVNWEDFYAKLGKNFEKGVKSESGKTKTETPLKSYHKYFCVVQADGDNVGKTISHSNLENEDVINISRALVVFGKKATEIIENYGGFPIYAGGDDLLCIVPVVRKAKKEDSKYVNILDLLDMIEKDAFAGVCKAVTDANKKEGIFDNGKKIEASLSFGVSISYYKYPLYEALEAARHLLFIAKDKKRFPNKKTVACKLRKHSGGTFEAAFSRMDADFVGKFSKLIANSADGDIVSSIAHKVRQEETIVDMVLDDYMKDRDSKRLDALFEKVLKFDSEKDTYFKTLKELMPVLYKEVEKERFPQALYSILRIAKFLNGEELHDE